MLGKNSKNSSTQKTIGKHNRVSTFRILEIKRRNRVVQFHWENLKSTIETNQKAKEFIQ